MDFTRYITKQGDRWDLIAWRAYGDITKQKEVMEANRDIMLVNSFDEGYTLILPIIPEVSTQDAQLPPWKRGTVNQSTTTVFLTTPKATATAPKSVGGADLAFDFFDYSLDANIG